MSAIAQDVTFKVAAPPAVVAGSNFVLVYEINRYNCTDFRPPAEISDAFDVLYGPVPSKAQSIQFINGRQTRTESTTFTYTLGAKKEGTFNIGPATVKIGNSEYKSESFKINVLPQDQTQQPQSQGAQTQSQGAQTQSQGAQTQSQGAQTQSQGAQTQSQGAQTQSQGRRRTVTSVVPPTTVYPSRGQQQGGETTSPGGINDENLFIRMIVAKRNVFEQESFLVTFKIYSTYDMIDVRPKFPEFEGFLSLDIELKNYSKILENYNGRNYQTVIVKQSILFPQRSGQLPIGSGKVDVTLRVQTQGRGRSIFEDFFGSYQDIEREVTSPPTTINVKPLPDGKPANFSNAVGNFTMTSEINRTQLKANEAVTIKLTFKGNGNIRWFKIPEVKFPNDFEVFDPKPDLNLRVTSSGVTGTRTIEYMAIPRYAGDFEIPPITFSYFDPQSGAYKAIPTGSFNLQVERDESSTSAPVISNFSNRESVRFLGKDIRYLKTQKINFQSYQDIFFGSLLYIMAYLMMSVLFVAFFIIYRKQVKENANIALVRTKKANKTAVRRLKQAEKLLRENKEEAFYEEVLRALWGYLSDKLNIPQSKLTKDNVASELTQRGVNEALAGEFLEIIHTCEFARYAPNKVSGAMDKLFGETINAIDTMENTIKK